MGEKGDVGVAGQQGLLPGHLGAGNHIQDLACHRLFADNRRFNISAFLRVSGYNLTSVVKG